MTDTKGEGTKVENEVCKKEGQRRIQTRVAEAIGTELDSLWLYRNRGVIHRLDVESTLLVEDLHRERQ